MSNNEPQENDTIKSGDGKEIFTEDTPSNYEFTDEQNGIFDEFSGRLKIVSIITLITSIISFIESFIMYKTDNVNQMLMYAGIGSLCLFISYWHSKASKAFRRIVETEGDDISFAMKALRGLQVYYKAFYGVATIAVVLTCVYTVFSIIG